MAGSIIPSKEGVAIGLAGDAISGFDTEHFATHTVMEGFWKKYREGGQLAGKLPTWGEYIEMEKRALQMGGVEQSAIDRAARYAKQQLSLYGESVNDLVPRIPKPIGSKKRTP